MAVYEGKWKCAYCGQMNLGRDVTCGQCGQTRGKDVKFIMDEGSAEVKDEALVGLAKGGADWTCSFCGTNNRGGLSKCRQCSAERGSSASLQEKRVGQAETGAAPGPAPAPRPRNKAVLFSVAAAAVLAIGALAYFLFFSTSVKSAVLERGTWERSIPIEENTWVTRTDWEDRIPGGAVILRQWEEKYGTEKIQTGTERRKTGQVDKGNGFFEDVYEDVPVYREQDVYKTKIEYRIREWVVVRTLKNSGDLADSPTWPAVTLAAAQREGRRSEAATLFLKLDDKNYTYGISVSDLGSYRIGGKYKIWVTALGAVKKLEAE